MTGLVLDLAYSQAALAWGTDTFSLHGLSDVRFISSAANVGWAERGLGKYADGGDVDRVQLHEALVTANARLGWSWRGTLTAKYASRATHAVDLTETFLSYRPVNTASWRVSARLGLFFPPFSLENTGTGWTSPYALSSSAINSWFGEELRTQGLEVHFTKHFEDQARVTVLAATVAHNDTAGALLAWRGFAVHDYESTLNDRLLLPTGIRIDQNFPQQALYSEPFVEVDGRVGYYAGFAYERKEALNVRGFHYDNRANPEALESGQYGWHTRFWNLGVKAAGPGDTTLIVQGLTGRISMGRLLNGKREVDLDMQGAFALVSKAYGKHRISARFDWFRVGENDASPADRNRETGSAWTLNYNLTLNGQHQFNLEWSRTSSNRPARAYLGMSPLQEESRWQIAYRLFF